MTNRRYPEHEKLKARRHETQTIHDFLEFASDKGANLCRWEEPNGDYSGGYEILCYRRQDELLAEFIGVDMKKIAEEKDAMVEELRSEH